MILHLVAVGRVKSASLREACDVYTRRLTRYQSLRIHEVRDAGRRDVDAAAARRVEAEAVQRVVPDGARLVALTRSGRPCSSAELARLLDSWRRDSRDVALVIGGAHGLDDDVLRRAATCLSLSALTLPHDLARVVLLEQLYRACTILRGEPYHKAGGV